MIVYFHKRKVSFDFRLFDFKCDYFNQNNAADIEFTVRIRATSIHRNPFFLVFLDESFSLDSRK